MKKKAKTKPIVLYVAGSRSLDGERIRTAIMSEYKKRKATALITAGDVRGVADVVKIIATENNIPLETVTAMASHAGGKYIERNRKLLQSCNFAFFIWDGYSRNTNADIELAKELKVKHTVLEMQPDDTDDVLGNGRVMLSAIAAKCKIAYNELEALVKDKAKAFPPLDKLGKIKERDALDWLNRKGYELPSVVLEKLNPDKPTSNPDEMSESEIRRNTALAKLRSENAKAELMEIDTARRKDELVETTVATAAFGFWVVELQSRMRAAGTKIAPKLAKATTTTECKNIVDTEFRELLEDAKKIDLEEKAAEAREMTKSQKHRAKAQQD